MSVSLEFRKVKRTGVIYAFLIGGLLAGAVPVVNMAFRSEIYLSLPATPMQILLDSSWQLTAMLNLLLFIVGATLLYEIEYKDNALQKMRTLPIHGSTIFFSKALLLFVLSFIVYAVEASALIISSVHWFALNDRFWMELASHFLYLLILSLPSILFALLIASASKNMWVSLGANVICLFLATMLLNKNFILSLFPFALPFHTLVGAETGEILQYTIAAFIEAAFIGMAAVIFQKIRREFG